MNSNNIKYIIRSFTLLDINDKFSIKLLIILSLINSLIQTLGIVSIMPFIAIVADPTLVESNETIRMIKESFDIKTYQTLLLTFGGFTFLSIVLSNFFSIFAFWANLRFFNHKEHQLTQELLNIYLSKKSVAFYRIKKSQILKYILSDVERVLIGTQMTVIDLISDIFICIIVISVLLYMDIFVTITTALSLSLSYIFIFILLSNKIKYYGKTFAQLESKVYASINHAIDMFREIRISGQKKQFVNTFSRPSEALADHAIRYYALSYLPIQLVEILAFGMVISISIYYSVSDNSSFNAISAISIYAFATYRLVPILKSIFENIEELTYNASTLKQLTEQYINKESDPSEAINTIRLNDRLSVKDVISLNNVSFQYAPQLPLILENFNISISQGKFTCISGRSGVGKSTILDIILGLSTPQAGNFYIDNITPTPEDIRHWQNNIGYVPQKIQFINGSVYQNIAFGVAPEKIDMEQVKTVAKLTLIDELIEQRLPLKYDSHLGDGGIMLSGGEKQRIGIARCLYHNPEVLIFDEATNELDPVTESKILDNIKTLPNKTIIFVTHKPAVIAIADQHIEIQEHHTDKARLD
ncbi:Lipid A export ATP-binding/permease protein MsbA [hydrothermal vent metagenome]|uniref:Lipid A export ATP-binding/permease protein MsbA n=1 Tax=hydrothermal vent metagenome TaxID=652676 RepID=A0A3B0WEN9_9ZZZZ